VGVVDRSRAILCRAVPYPYRPIRSKQITVERHPNSQPANSDELQGTGRTLSACFASSFSSAATLSVAPLSFTAAASRSART
jgi:hypothetical protein